MRGALSHTGGLSHSETRPGAQPGCSAQQAWAVPALLSPLGGGTGQACFPVLNWAGSLWASWGWEVVSDRNRLRRVARLPAVLQF